MVVNNWRKDLPGRPSWTQVSHHDQCDDKFKFRSTEGPGLPGAQWYNNNNNLLHQENFFRSYLP
jgi:hypothetical protein